MKSGKKTLIQFNKTREYRQKLRDRAEIITNCEINPLARGIVKEMCKRDTVFFINNFLYTYDPRKKFGEAHLPFILFDYQEDLILWIEQHLKEGSDGLLEKSRDMGVTWVFLSVLLKHWLFDETFST